MNEELEKKLIDSIDRVQEWVDTAGEFAAEQAPLVVQEVINWGIISYSIWSAVNLLLLVGVCSLICWVARKCSDFEPVLLLSMPALVLLGAFAYNACGVVYVLAAPRLYVLEQLSSLLK